MINNNGYANVVKDLQTVGLVWKFRIYVVASITWSPDPTKDVINSKQVAAQNDVYVAQAYADWTFDGDGSVSNGTWTGAPDSGITPPDAWHAATADMTAQIVTGKTFKDRLNYYLVNNWKALKWAQVRG